MTVSGITVSAPELFCPSCGYDLRSIESNRCPECGLEVDRSANGISQLPWTHRKRLGLVRAYFATVWLTMRHPLRFTQEIERPVRYADAQWFRLITIAIAAAGPLAVIIGVMWQNQWPFAEWAESGFPVAMVLQNNDQGPSITVLLPWIVGAALPPVVPLAIVLLLVLITGAGSYFVAPRSASVARQNSAIALSYYASAPLLWIPILCVAGALMPLVERLFPHDRHMRESILIGLGLFIVAIFLFMLLSMGLSVSRLVKAVSGGFFAYAGIFICGILSIALALGAFPWIVGFVTIVIDSVR